MLAPLAVNIDQAAEMIGCSRSKLYALIAEGKINARKQDRRTLVLVADLNDYLQALPSLNLAKAAS